MISLNFFKRRKDALVCSTDMKTIIHQTSGGRTSISLLVWCGIMAKLYSLHPKIFAEILTWSCHLLKEAFDGPTVKASCFGTESLSHQGLQLRTAIRDSETLTEQVTTQRRSAIDLWYSVSHVRAHIWRHLSTARMISWH